MPSGICTAKRRLWVDGDGAPGKGQRANRNALATSPDLKAMKERIFKRRKLVDSKKRATQYKSGPREASPALEIKNNDWYIRKKLNRSAYVMEIILRTV